VSPRDALQLSADEIARRAGPGKTVVFVSGNFNIVHPGHLRLLQFAKECGDFLVVGVNAEGTLGATIPEEMRLEGVRAISLVDFALLLREPPEAFIARLKPAVVVKGKEYEDRDNPEQEAITACGGKLLFGSGEVRFSSLDLLRREYLETDFSSIVKPTEYAARHGFRVSDLKSALARLARVKVLVVGDLIVDEYVTCEPLGMSQEDPTIVVTPIETRRFVGGAGIVAAHARGLGAQVHFVSVCGEDEAADYARGALGGFGVSANLIPDASRPTTLKRRYRAASKTLLRVSQLRQHDVSGEIAESIHANAIERLRDVDVLVFSDFNYGCLPQELVEKLINEAERCNVMVVADSQASSQISDVSRFRNAALITPTEREARLALRDFSSGLVVLAETLSRRANSRNVVVTLGAEGLLISAREHGESFTDRLPAFNTAPRDPAGAGDSLLASASLALASGIDIWQSIYLGALAAACQVSRLGNTPLTQQDLTREIDLP